MRGGKETPHRRLLAREPEANTSRLQLFPNSKDGNEVDVDVVMSQGEWRYAAVTDNGPTLEPYFNETYAVCPSVLPSNRQKELKDLAISTLKCLGFTEGVFHVECKYTSHGPHLIEVNARMGGGQVHETNLRVWGVDLVEETLFVAAGIPCRPFIAESRLTSVLGVTVTQAAALTLSVS